MANTGRLSHFVLCLWAATGSGVSLEMSSLLAVLNIRTEASLIQCSEAKSKDVFFVTHTPNLLLRSRRDHGDCGEDWSQTAPIIQ